MRKLTFSICLFLLFYCHECGNLIYSPDKLTVFLFTDLDAETTKESVEKFFDRINISFTESNESTSAAENSYILKLARFKRWEIQKYEKLPNWLQDNRFLLNGHRPHLPSFMECLKSIFSIHSETGNIWTHLLGCIAFFFLAVWFLVHAEDGTNLQEKIVFSFFFAGAIICLGLSFLCHTFACYSSEVMITLTKLDYVGITTLIIGSFIPFIYYCFYYRLWPKIIYISMIAIFGTAAIIVSLWDIFADPWFRPIRAGIFVAMGLSGLLPIAHLLFTDGIRALVYEMSLIPLIIMAFLDIFGATIYAFRFPEKLFPGHFDLWFQSHQLFHLCTVTAAFIHYYGIQKLAHLRLKKENSPTSKSQNQELTQLL